MIPLPPPEDTARRTRAALAYAGIDVKDSQERVGIGYATMQRIVSLNNPRGARSRDELERIASATGVPLQFFLEGFAPDEPSLAERVEDLEGTVTQLRAGLASLAAGNLQRTRALLDQLEKGRPAGPSAEGS